MLLSQCLFGVDFGRVQSHSVPAVPTYYSTVTRLRYSLICFLAADTCTTTAWVGSVSCEEKLAAATELPAIAAVYLFVRKWHFSNQPVDCRLLSEKMKLGVLFGISILSAGASQSR